METETLTNYVTQKLSTTTLSIKNNRLLLNINTIREHDEALSKNLIHDNINILPLLEEELLLNKLITEGTQIGFTGSLGKNKLNPRLVNSTNIGQLISINGIVTKVSKIRPKLQKSVHFKSDNSNKTIYDPFKVEYTKEKSKEKPVFFEKEYRDYLSISKYPQTTTIVPKISSDGMLLNIEHGLSVYYDYQVVTVQELPETAPIGVMPVSIDIILTHDLCDMIKPGDRPIIYGTLKALNINIQNTENSIIRTVLLANNIELNNQKTVEISYTNLFKKYGTTDFLNNLHKFIAPSIYGNEKIKKSILLQLMSHHTNKELHAKRNTINILLVGDPSTAKSQMLRYTLNTAELSVSTTGRGSSGVGLTASVVISDDGTNDRMLAAGALVIADGGVCCIDEFDKMSHFDRIALHEAMEQGTVSISKAGIHATLNSRTCVLAAANPILGSYNDELSIGDNLGLEMSLVSRFDVIWVLRDHRNPDWDYRVSTHVLNLEHEDRLSSFMNSKGEPVTFDTDTSTQETGDKENVNQTNKFKEALTSIQIQEFIKEHIKRAKTYDPILTKPAAERLIDFYTEIRKTDTQFFSSARRIKNYKTQKNFKKESNVDLQLPVTPRLLDSLIRLATNQARLHLRNEVNSVDVEVAIEIIRESRNILVDPSFTVINEEVIEEDTVVFKAEINENNISLIKKALLHFKELGGAVSIESIHDHLEILNLEDIKDILKYLDEEEGLIMFSNGLVLFLD